jgi:hypothetical protein
LIINLKTCSEIVNRIAYFNDEPTKILKKGLKLSKEIENKVVKEIENREYKTTCNICVKFDEFKID